MYLFFVTYHSESSRFFYIELLGSIDRDFDEGLLPRISNISYEDEVNDISSAPDVGNYLITEVSSESLLLLCSLLSK